VSKVHSRRCLQFFDFFDFRLFLRIFYFRKWPWTRISGRTVNKLCNVGSRKVEMLGVPTCNRRSMPDRNNLHLLEGPGGRLNFHNSSSTLNPSGQKFENVLPEVLPYTVMVSMELRHCVVPNTQEAKRHTPKFIANQERPIVIYLVWA